MAIGETSKKKFFPANWSHVLQDQIPEVPDPIV